MSLIILQFIMKFKYFSLGTLNNRIQHFNYGSINIQNQPQLISMNYLKNTKLKMYASELFCFVQFFGQIIEVLVTTSSDIWQLYVILKKIIDTYYYFKMYSE